jgi:hypothetical protein
VKKLFLVFLVLPVGMAGLSAAPPGSDGVNDTPQVVMPQAVSIAVSEIQAPISGSCIRINTVFCQPALSFSPILFVDFITAPDNTTAFTEDIELICLWADQYRQGLLTQDEFKTLVAGRIVIAARDYSVISRLKTDTNGMRSLAEKTRIKVDRLFMYRELQLGIPVFVNEKGLPVNPETGEVIPHFL